ncbi:MAG: histidine kinase [Flavobacteriales bacterium]|nr:MAG: histidine kinase [Flavobacteriales bacterium]
MKNKIIQLLMVLISLGLFGQTGKEIIEKNIEKSGGARAWKLLHTIQLKGSVTLSLTEEFPIEILQARPNLTKTSIWINNQKRTIEGFDGKQGYEIDYAKNQLVVNPQYKVQSFDNDFLDFENKGFKARFLGKENIDGISTYKVELTKNVNKTYYYFDTKTYMLIKEENQEETLLYKNYKRIGNLFFPFRIEGSNPKKKTDYVLNFNEIKTNKAFPKSTFRF